MKPYVTRIEYPRLYLLAAGLLLLSNCSSENNEEGKYSVVVSGLERESLYFRRARDSIVDASGAWSMPSIFRILDDTEVSAGSPDTKMIATGSVEEGLFDGDSADDVTRPMAKGTSNGVRKDVSPRISSIRAVKPAIGFELAVLDVKADQLKANALFKGQSVCSAVGCAGMSAVVTSNNAEVVGARLVPTGEEQSAAGTVTGSAAVVLQGVLEPDVAGQHAEIEAGQGVVSDQITIEPAESWHLKGTANAVVTSGDILFVGGDFTEIYDGKGGSLRRTYLAALDRYTGEPTSFAPILDGKVWALALSPDNETLYVGGSFLTAEGLTRKRVAAYDVQTGALTNFVTPTPNGALRAIAVDDDRLYLGGLFTRVGTEKRSYVAALDLATGELDHDFVASPNNRVKALVAEIDRLWIGGDFTRINGTTQQGVGAVDPADGSLQATDDVAYPVIALAVSDTQLFIAGGGPGGRAAAFDRATGIEQWEISSDGNFQAVDVEEGRFVYFGGHYEIIEGDESIDRLTRHDKKTGRTDVSWLPRINGYRSINAIAVTPDGLHIGGDFTRVDAEPHEGFAILPGLTH